MRLFVSAQGWLLMYELSFDFSAFIKKGHASHFHCFQDGSCKKLIHLEVMTSILNHLNLVSEEYFYLFIYLFIFFRFNEINHAKNISKNTKAIVLRKKPREQISLK